MLINPRITVSMGKQIADSDIYSYLLGNRIIFFNDEIEDDVAQSVISQLLFLEKTDPNSDIVLYINSPGGVVSAGLAIYDTMNYISCDVSTICLGSCASMGAFLLSSGTKGKRYILPNGEVMIHQPSGGAMGQCSDIEITAKNILKTKNKLNEIIAMNTCQPLEKVTKDTDRDYWMDAKEAVEYGIVDSIIYKR